MLYFMVTQFKLCFDLVHPANGIRSHVPGNVQTFKLPTVKANKRDVGVDFDHVVRMIRDRTVLVYVTIILL